MVDRQERLSSFKLKDRGEDYNTKRLSQPVHAGHSARRRSRQDRISNLQQILQEMKNRVGASVGDYLSTLRIAEAGAALTTVLRAT